MTDEKRYTLAEIKAAFWATFHEAGEIWLPYGDDKEGNEEATEDWWGDFVEALPKQADDVRFERGEG
jgi:hypothetical protein